MINVGAGPIPRSVRVGVVAAGTGSLTTGQIAGRDPNSWLRLGLTGAAIMDGLATGVTRRDRYEVPLTAIARCEWLARFAGPSEIVTIS